LVEASIDTPPDPPVALILKRKSIRLFPDGARVALYFNDKLNRFFTVPYGPLITGPFTITSSTDKVDTRVRGRQVSLKIENDAVNETWRYGTLRLDIEAGGRR